MDVRRLDLLRELAERGSVHAVATATHRTPSAVSQQIKLLEREAGLPLTERSGRGIILTDAGRALAASAIDVAAAIARAEATWDEYIGDPTGHVRVATFPTAGQTFVPPAVAALSRLPGLTVELTNRDADMTDFPSLTADWDIVIAYSLPGQRSWSGRGLRNIYLLSEPLDVVLPLGHRLAGKSELTPEDLVGEPWIGVPEEFAFDRLLHELEAVTHSEIEVVQRISDNLITEALVAQGIGVAFAPRFTASGPEKGIVTRPLTGVEAFRHVLMLMRPDKAERLAVRTVADEIRRQAVALEASHTPAEEPPLVGPRWV
ncbi:LysR family transcriptional regulator [Labedella endophytica]|uniref:LysR family transcriptional regulator n=1 Tax=Labedella endophytica TaxID=1523160 RepID=A0A433JT78_9MICO|nr:LysR family transcriptional regulator [Labedella endophytica]RUR01602.1 LysR family transcriptional regulator [Labedella endophytica]